MILFIYIFLGKIVLQVFKVFKIGPITKLIMVIPFAQGVLDKVIVIKKSQSFDPIEIGHIFGLLYKHPSFFTLEAFVNLFFAVSDYP